MQFAAAELRQGETAHDVVRHIMETAHSTHHMFSTLELLGILTLGRLKFVRFRADSPDLHNILATTERGYVRQMGGSYQLVFPGVKPAQVTITAMQSTADLGVRRLYRGPKVTFWERQFI